MKKYYKVFLLILSLMLTFSGCTNGGNKNSKEIVVWCHLNDAEVIQVRKIAEQWGKQTGNKVKVHSDRGDNRAYIEATKSGMGPDIEFGVSHDRMEKLSSEGLLAQVPEKVMNKDKYIPSAIETTSFNNKIYGIPVSIETYALYYNKDKVKTPPQTLQELIEEGKKLGFQYDINNFYLSFPFLQVNGGYIFKKNNGKYNVKDIGLSNEGAIKGYGIIQDMVQKYKLMPENVESITARENFKNGKTAFYISGSWDLDEINKANINYSVVPLPRYNDKQMTTFVTTQVAYVSSKSTKQKESWELMNYFMDKTPEALYKINGRIPALKTENSIQQVRDNEKVKMFVKQAEYGEIVPNVSEVQALQTSNKIMMMLTSGKISPKECGDKIELQIINFMKKEKQQIY